MVNQGIISSVVIYRSFLGGERIMWLWYVLGAVVVFMIVNAIIQSRKVKTLTEEEFKAGYRKAQLIDVREQNEFENGHILGARNIPLTQMRMRHKEIRADQPVYLYCANGFRSVRAASTLRKKGIKDLYQLKGGFKKWSGKVKSKK